MIYNTEESSVVNILYHVISDTITLNLSKTELDCFVSMTTHTIEKTNPVKKD